VALEGESALNEGAGLTTVKVLDAEAPPPGAGLNTLTAAVRAEATSAAGIVAVKLVLSMKTAVRFEPFQRTTEPATKFEPVSVKLKPGPPAVELEGASALNEGAGLATVKVLDAEAPPPGAGLNTRTAAVRAEARSAAGIAAVKRVALAKTVVRSESFHRTTAPLTKFEPVTVKVKPGPPAAAEAGLSLETEGRD